MTRSLKVGVALGLVALVGLAVPAARAAEADKLLPADATAVVVVNVKQTLESPFGKKYLADLIKTALQQSAEAQKILTATGVDPQKDVTTIVVASSGADPDKSVVIVRGSFDPTKAAAAAAEYAKKNPDHLKITKEGDTAIYETKGDGSSSVFGAFVDKTTVVLSPSKSAVTDALKGGKTAPKLKKEFAALVEKADAKQAIWLAAVVTDDMRKMLAAQEQTKDIADKVNGTVGGLAVEKDLQLTLTIVTTDAKAADTVSDLLSSLKGVAKLVIGSNKEFGKTLVPLVDSVKITTSKSDVVVTSRVTEEMIDKLMKLMPGKP